MNTNSKTEQVTTCIACGKELPAFQPRPRIKPACDNKECRRTAYNTPARKNLTIKEGEMFCAREGCGRPVPAGEYDISKTLFFCRPACRSKYKRADNSTATAKKRTIKEGEVLCAREGCGCPIPPGDYDIIKTVFFCGQLCRGRHYAAKKAANSTPAPKKRTIKEGEVFCAREGCGRPVPAGDCAHWKTLFFCGRGCERKYYAANYVVGQCRQCGGDIHDYPFMMGKRAFCSIAHKQIYQGQERLEHEAGPFAPLLTEYLATYARGHYSPDALKAKRLELISFLGFANGLGITNLEDVGPAVVTKFIAHELKRGLENRNFVGGVSKFFGWMIVEGRRRNPNPVVRGFHNSRNKECMPRPYSDSELKERWTIVEEHGTLIEKLAFSIGIETGMRGGELRNVRLEDVNEKAQSIFIRRSKNGTTRTTLFHDKVQRYLAEWKQLRDPYCGHDHLLHNQHYRPITNTGYIQTMIKETLAKHGVAEFSFHRLRHSWATGLANAGVDLMTIMALGGWRTLDGLKRYLQTSRKRMEDSYRDAMVKAQEDREQADEQVTSLTDFAFSDELDETTPIVSAA